VSSRRSNPVLLLFIYWIATPAARNDKGVMKCLPYHTTLNNWQNLNNQQKRKRVKENIKNLMSFLTFP
jgi:hypothetical protein